MPLDLQSGLNWFTSGGQYFGGEYFDLTHRPFAVGMRAVKDNNQLMKQILLLSTIASLAFLLAPATAAEKDTRVYEMRIYYAAPGKLDDLNARFRNHTTKLFEKHGMKNVGYWVPQDNPENKLIYILSHESREAAKQSWKNFSADPDWQAARKASEVNGRLVTKADVIFMNPTDYTPAIAPSTAPQQRVYEMRTYVAAPGKLDDLNARFRNHTVGLFSKHGIGHLGYWTPADQNKGADNTLIYIIIHNSREAATASFNAFRADPAWVAARKASEEKAGGSLTSKVESVFMNPVDYSLAK